MATYNQNGRTVSQTDEQRPSWRAEDDVLRGRRDDERGRDRDDRDDDRYASDRDRDRDRDRDVDRERGSQRWSGWSGRERSSRWDEDRDEGYRSTERYGQGQSGYGSGRYGGDRSMGMASRTQGYSGGYEDRRSPSTDDRFTGRGGQGYWMDRGERGYGERGYGERDFEERGRWRERTGYGGSRGMESQDTGYLYGQHSGIGSQGGYGNYGWQGSQGGMQGQYGYGGQGPGQGRVGGYAREGGMGGMGMERGGHRGKGPQGYTRSDDRIRENVCEALSDDDNIDATNIEVVVRGGEVVLSGTVDDRSMKRMAEDVVERVAGVKDVQNQIKVRERKERGQLAQTGKETGKETETGSTDKRHRA